MSATTKSVDASLWWEPFSSLLTGLENASPSDDLPEPLAKKVKENHDWFVETVARFKPQNDKSKEALISSQKIKIGTHELTVKPDFRDKALQVSSYLCLDEVQSYILVDRYLEHGNDADNYIVHDPIHVVLLQYYIERQCLFKCTGQILMHALYLGNSLKGGSLIREEALKLISDGLEGKLLSVLEALLLCSHPEQMDVDLFTLWAEETLLEENLVLDIIFLIYYESLCTCSAEKWKKMCSLYKGTLSGSYNFGKLAISSEALSSFYHAKVQLLLILIETLNLENLLQMVHDAVPFRQGACVFTLTDVKEIDALISGFDIFEMREAGPLILAWAVFLCLISSLPRKEETNELTEIDHVGYVRQAFEASSLSYFLEILQSDILKESDGPIAGYRSVLRTFISAFIASYEISLQLEDGTFTLILDILCYVYRGEESLCIQFWDRASFIDGPIRCLLCNLEGEFPFRTVELLRLLSSLCEGSWPAECVYNFLDKSTGISSLLDITSESLLDRISQIVETQHPVSIPGVDGLHIPSRTRGHILKVIGGESALVRWEHTKSAVFVLLLRLAQTPYLENNEEAFLILDLLGRMVSSNMAVCFSLMDSCNLLHVQATDLHGQLENNVWVVEIISIMVRNLSPNPSGAALMSMALLILSKMLKCSPSRVAAVALKTNIFDVASNSSIFNVGWNGLSSGSWLLSGKLAKMLLIDGEQNDYDCPLTISVLDFTMQLLSTGVEDDIVVSLIVFSLQYILVNHEYWKYKVQNIRWKVTLKVLELMKTCILATSSSEKLSDVIRDLLLYDSSIHNTLFRIMCTTSEALERLYLNRLIDLVEIEGLLHAISSALDVSYIMLTNFSKDMTSSIPAFHQAMLSSMTKPIPVTTAAISLISFFRDPAIQVGAAKLLSVLLGMAKPHPANSCFGPDDKQMTDLRHSINRILIEHWILNEDLFIAILNLLTSAARYQPAFLVAIFETKGDTDIQLANAGGVQQTANETLSGSLGSETSRLLDAVLHFLARYDDVINSNPCVLLNVLNFLKSLWHGAGQYTTILERLKSSDKLWKQLSSFISQTAGSEVPLLKSMKDSEALLLGHRYQCQSAILETMAYDMFLMKKLLYAESLVKEPPESNKKAEADNYVLKNILSDWCKSSILGSLIKSYASFKYDNEIYFRAKVALSLLTVHIMGKIVARDAGSLSVSLVEKIRIVFKKLTSQPAFSELLAQYTLHRYSEGKELKALILSDLYYHLQGELEGRKMSVGPFKELSQFLLESNVVKFYENKCSVNPFSTADHDFVFDLGRIKADLGLDLWDYSEWKTSKAIADTMLCCMQEANTMVLIGNSKLSSLKSLITVLTVYKDSLLEKMTGVGGKIPDQLIFSCMDHICQSFLDTLEPLSSVPDVSKDVLDFLTAQADLLLHLMRSVSKSLFISLCILVLQTSGTGLKVLSDIRTIVSGVNKPMKLLIMLILSAMEFCLPDSHITGVKDKESVEGFAEISNVILGLLPILCNCITIAECCSLSMTALDLTLKSFLTPDTWFPIIHKHLQLQHVVLKLQDKKSIGSVPILLKFFLTVAHVRGGAEMLLNAGFFSSLKVLFADMSDGRVSSVINSGKKRSTLSDKTEKPQLVWGLGLAVVSAMVHSLGDSTSCIDITGNLIPYFFSEKAHLIYFFLSAPDFPSDDHDKKRPRAQRTWTSLSSLMETEQTLILMCVLASNWNSWVKAMKDTDSQLREMSIHLLAFISRGNQRHGEAPSRTAPLLCPPTLKDEFDCCRKPSFINSRNGWFALSPLGCVPKPKFSGISTTTALVTKDQATESNSHVSRTYFSDSVAIQIYRITFLLLKFLCLQAEGAAKRAEELGYVDLAHFPELPMPEILHGIQDQAIAIVVELCETNRLKQIDSEIRSVCLLLLQTMEMALYLELCVLQICGIRPVLGRVEDFSKEVKLLMKATEGHAFLKGSMKSLNRIISLVYPGLL